MFPLINYLYINILFYKNIYGTHILKKKQELNIIFEFYTFSKVCV